MNSEQSHPPVFAVWLLRHLYPQRNRDAIIGDLLEGLNEGHSDGWFWRQVLIAILVGYSSQVSLRWEFFLAATGTTLIWCVPWGLILPITAMNTSMNWATQWPWFFVLEIVTALLVLPLFTIYFCLRKTLSWASLLRVFFLSAVLFATNDLMAWTYVGDLTINRSQAIWAVMLQLGGIFAALLITAGIAGRSPSQTQLLGRY